MPWTIWMNEWEIEDAQQRFVGDPVLGPASRFLSEFRHEVNAHSDGWPYWRAPSRAAGKLMALVHGQMFSGMGAYPRVPPPSAAEVRKCLTPIKTFMTRRGYKAGMRLPALEV